MAPEDTRETRGDGRDAATPPAPTRPSTRDRDVARLLASLPAGPGPMPVPALVAVCGLPGSGKSFFSRSLAGRFPILRLESDALRRVLFPTPLHSPQENARLFPAIHRVIDTLLERRVPVLLDATNLEEGQRRPLYRIARCRAARLVLVWVEAPEGLVRHRLSRRATPSRHPEDLSEADWRVYLRLRESVEPVARRHYRVDTSRDIRPAVERVAEELWECQRRGQPSPPSGDAEDLGGQGRTGQG